MRKYAKLISDYDNVATVLADFKCGERVTVKKGGDEITLICNQDIPFGHKIAIKKIRKSKDIVKYGEKIGTAKQDINIGDWVHTHNVLDDYICKDKKGKPLPGQV